MASNGAEMVPRTERRSDKSNKRLKCDSDLHCLISPLWAFWARAEKSQGEISKEVDFLFQRPKSGSNHRWSERGNKGNHIATPALRRCIGIQRSRVFVALGEVHSAPFF